MPPRPVRAALLAAAGMMGAATLGFAMTGGGQEQKPLSIPSQGLNPPSILASPAEAGSRTGSLHPDAALLLYTGEQRGHLEPCGCTQPQIGGLPRRAAFLASLSRGPAPVVVDDGDMVEDPGRQSQLKAEAMAAFYRSSGYAAVNMGEQDFRLGFGYLRALQAQAKLPFLAANVRLGDRPALAETASVSGVTLVGVIAASLGPDVKRWNRMLAVETPETALARLEPALKRAGRAVLLFHGGPDEARPLARRFPWLAAIVTAHEADDYRPEPLLEAGVPIVNAGRWGKVVGRLELGPNGARPLSPVTLGPEWPDAPAARALMSRYLGRVNAEALLDRVPELSRGSFRDVAAQRPRPRLPGIGHSRPRSRPGLRRLPRGRAGQPVRLPLPLRHPASHRCRLRELPRRRRGPRQGASPALYASRRGSHLPPLPRGGAEPALRFHGILGEDPALARLAYAGKHSGGET
jgi:hypothetical protein